MFISQLSCLLMLTNYEKHCSFNFFIYLLAERPGIARGKKNAAQWVRLAIRNRSSRLAGFTQHIYEFLVLLYRKLWNLVKLNNNFLDSVLNAWMYCKCKVKCTFILSIFLDDLTCAKTFFDWLWIINFKLKVWFNNRKELDHNIKNKILPWDDTL